MIAQTMERIAEALKDAMRAAIDDLGVRKYDKSALQRYFREEVETAIDKAREDWMVAINMGLSQNGYEGFVAEMKRAAIRAAKRALD
jgi:hypothetical protein